MDKDNKKRPKAITSAYAAKYVTTLPEYQETIGAWITQLRDQALHDLRTATPENFQQAQGKLLAAEELIEQIASALAAYEAHIKRNKQ